jgi:hypothetical protein
VASAFQVSLQTDTLCIARTRNDPPKRVIDLALASMLFLSCLSWYFQVWEGPAFVAYPLGPTVVPPLVEPPPVDWPVLPLLEPPLLLPPWLQSRSRSRS